ncbi:hypothetical protein M5K25_024167 [Dendrobium thyrsiflorum]|uniref:Serine-threonine/tyrosine-protein kinase catalytic domain-containing protein n=1 Tax=Dendrobium thyrsiflorum TaxID=117978 RepID=A0ABD0U1F9_DENTH
MLKLSLRALHTLCASACTLTTRSYKTEAADPPPSAAPLDPSHNIRPPLPPCCPMALKHLIKQCWDTNPNKRPHFEEIVTTLEMYRESFEEDPSSLFYKPSQQQPPRCCFPR